MDFALAHPERVDKVVLTSSGIVGFQEKYPVDSVTLTYFPQLKAALDSNNLKRGAEIFTYYWGDSPFRGAQEVSPGMHRYVYQTTYKNLQEHSFRQWPQFAEPAAINLLAKLKAPVLMIRGDKDLQMIADAGKVLDEQVVNSTKVVFKGGDHMLNMEFPKQYNAAVLQFLR
jgi:3-oxoadipate enol-lactonase